MSLYVQKTKNLRLKHQNIKTNMGFSSGLSVIAKFTLPGYRPFLLEIDKSHVMYQEETKTSNLKWKFMNEILIVHHSAHQKQP